MGQSSYKINFDHVKT